MKQEHSSTLSPFKMTALQSLSNSYIDYNLSNSKISTYSQAQKTNLSHSKYRLLQQLSNDNQFNLIEDQITTYLDENGNQIDINNLKVQNQKQNEQQKSNPNNYIDKNRKNAFFIEEISQLESKPVEKNLNTKNTIKKSNQIADIESVWQSRFAKQNNRREKVYDSRIHNIQLAGIQSIIDEISSIMEKSKVEDNKEKVNFSSQSNIYGSKHRPNKKKFKDWSIRNNMTSKLDDLLISYKTDGDMLSNQTANFSQSKKNYLQQDRISEAYSHHEGENEQNQFQDLGMMDFSQINKKQLMDLKNIDLNDSGSQPYLIVLVVKWDSLPSMPGYSSFLIDLLSKSTANLAYPSQASYGSLIKQIGEKQINHYSIFSKQNNKQIVGVYKQNGQQKLRTEQQYMKFWQQSYNGDQLGEQKKQYLMQYDIEWYRALVEFTYGQGLQNLLDKQQGYDINKYIDLIKKIQTSMEKQDVNIIKQKLLKHYINIKRQKSEDQQNKQKNLILIIENAKDFQLKKITQDCITVEKENTCLKVICFLNQLSKMEKKQIDCIDIYTQEQWSDIQILINKGISSEKQKKFNKNILHIQNKNEQTLVDFIAQDQEVKRNLKIHDEVQFGKVYYLIKQ